MTIFDRKKGTVPTGLYEELIDTLKKIQESGSLKIKEVDLRGEPITAKLPKNIVMSGEGVKTLKPRKEQLESVQAVLDNQRGILLNATNFGKSLCAYILFQILEPKVSRYGKLLFVAPNTSIMKQLHKNFKAYLDEDIGIWGDGKKDLEPKIVCATIQSIASAIKKPEIRLTKKSDKLLERMVTKHMPLIMEGSTPRNNLNLYVRNYKPEYKYESEDIKELTMMKNTLRSDREVRKYFKDAQKQYEKLLLSKDKKGFKKYNQALDFLDSVNVVIADECQSAKAKSYQDVFALMPNARMRVGMSGTIETNKHDFYYPIKAILEKPIYDVDNDFMIKKGYSAKPHIKMVSFNEPADLEEQVQRLIIMNRIPKSQQALYRYQQSYRIGIIENEKRNKLIAQLAIKLSQKKEKMATLIMVNSIEHGENIEKYLKEAKVPYAYVQGADDSETRNKVLDEVRSGKIKILLATKIFDAGIDVPNLKYFISSSSGKSYVQVLQRIGRMLRVTESKPDVYIFDIMDRESEYLFKQSKIREKYYRDQKFDISE